MTGPQHEVFHAGDVRLQSGVTLADARLAYLTLGTLSPARDNVVLLPTYYTGSHRQCAQMVGPGRALDPERWFVIIPDMLGNGVSSSPSNTPPPQGGADFPRVTILDNVRLQRRLLTEHLGIDSLALVVGWSMGAQQAFQWAVSYPDAMGGVLALCGAARTSPHNHVFLEGVKAALTADPTWQGGRYDSPPRAGLEAFGRVYAGWAYSQAFFRLGLYRELGFDSADALLTFWAEDHAAWDANDLLAMLATWDAFDVSANDAFNGDFAAALGAIRAPTIVMPGSSDLYFPPEDSAIEVGLIAGAELRVIESDWGHIAGSPVYDTASNPVIDAAIDALLATRG